MTTKKIKTIKQFEEQASFIPKKLIRATIKQFGGWDSFQESAPDVYSHGVDGGFADFIYYTDTVAFTKRNKKEIIELCSYMSNEMDEAGVISFVASFNCIKGYTQEEIADGIYNPRSEHQTQIFNALAWFAGEEVCRAYCYLNEEN